MKKNAFWLSVLISLWVSGNGLAQSAGSVEKMSVSERMAKARSAKSQKKAAGSPTKKVLHDEKATAADYRAPVDKTQKGPHGEVVHTGERGGKFYINPNGNKTYLSSNQ